MNVPETDISVPMPQIVSNSPTHSLPDISYSGLSTVASPTASQLMSAEVPPEDVTISPNVQQEQTLSTSQEFTDTVTLPALQRAMSTSLRLEHTASDAQPPEDAGLSCNSSDNNVAFFPMAGTSQDADKSVSLSSGCICKNTSSGDDRNNVRASDTALLSGTASTNGYVRSPSLEHIRSAIRRLLPPGFASGGSNPENNERCVIARKDSTVSSRSGAGGNRYGSSIFGSKIFESVSTSSFGSQRINIVAESPSIEPVFSGYYSASCDESSFPYQASFLAARDVRKKSRFRTSSASSDLESTRLSSSGENVSLQRTQSLPSRHASSLPGVLIDEVSDSVAELSAAASASGSTAKKKWQLTMPELIEGPENDTLTVHGQKREHLAAAALAIVRGEYKASADGKQMILDERLATDASELSDVDLPAEKRKYIKNLLVMSASHFFLFSSYFALRNLQSSLNAAGGLGLYALSSIYCSLVFGCLFSTTIVQRLQPKRTMSLSLTGFVLYSAANFYPRFYTMIPVSVIHGFFMAVNYTAQSTYLANISAGYADLVGKQMKHVLSQFHGTFFIFLQFSQIAGGLISSLLLSKPSLHGDYVSYAGVTYTNDSYNSSFGDNLYRHSVYGDNTSTPCCGSSYCPSDSEDRESTSDIDETTLLVLMGCFGACTVAGCITVILFLDPLEGVMKKSSAKLSQQMTAVFRFFFQRHACLAVGLSFYSLLQVGFIFGEFTKAYVTCAIGVHYVGFLMMTLSLTTGITAYVSGHLQQYTGRMSLILTALCLQFTLLMVLYFWSPSEQTLHVFFIVIAIWGLGDGMLITQIVSLYGTLFEANKEAAFAAHKLCQAVSGFSLFMTAPYLCTDVKILVILSVLLVALSAYVALEVLLKLRKQKNLPIQELVVTVDGVELTKDDDDIKT